MQQQQSRLEINIRLFDEKSDAAFSTTELKRVYDCDMKVLNTFVDSLLVSLVSGEPKEEMVINVNKEDVIDDHQ